MRMMRRNVEMPVISSAQTGYLFLFEGAEAFLDVRVEKIHRVLPVHELRDGVEPPLVLHERREVR